MPREIFGDVTKPSIKIGNRKWYTVPVSLFSHAMIVFAFVLIPILAPSAMPLLKGGIDVFNAPPPTPPDPPRPKVVEARPVSQPVNPNAAPTSMPNEIKPEVPVDPGSDNPTPGLIPGPISNGPPEAPPVRVEKPSPDVPIPVGGLIRQPVKIGGQPPVYPQIAQQAHVQGVVIIEATIGTDGKVMNARVLRSIPLLDQAALDAVKQWQYSPTLLNGIPVAVIMTVTVNFSLN